MVSLSTEQSAEPLQQLEVHLAQHPSLPPEAVLKADLLRRGLTFAPEALIPTGTQAAHQPKSYFIFSFDMMRQSELDQVQQWKAPEEIALHNGPLNLRRTIVSVRLNNRSPYKVIVADGQRWLTANGERLAEIELPKMPPYYGMTLPDGRAVAEVAPTIEWGYLLYLTVFRICQYFGGKEECQFCDINHNYRQQIKAGRPYTGVKKVQDILAALEAIDASGSASKAYTITGGSVTTKLQGQTEAEFYIQYVDAIERRFPGRWISKLVTQAWPVDDVKRLQAAGAQIYHPNYEVWDADLFAKLCPGKDRYIGRAEWLQRILDSAKVFPASHVIPNFVAGIEMAEPYGFTDVEKAVRSTEQGLDYFMQHGVTPRFTTWCPEPNTPLGDTNPDGAPLAYHLRLLEVYRDALKRHGLRPPPGYGESGPGKAVFSVSPFMDVLD